MKRKLGIGMMIAGAVLVLTALSLFLYNRQEEASAAKSVQKLLPVLVERIQENSDAVESTGQPVIPDTLLELLKPEDVEMKQVEIDGYGYVGYLSIPSWNLELPIMGDWDYARLRIAPCRYFGTVRGENLVLMAHNYRWHFGRLSELSLGDSVLFTDMDGVVTRYRVAAKDVLPPDSVEEMTAGAFDLTLFTCTYGGQSRVVVFCEKEES